MNNENITLRHSRRSKLTKQILMQYITTFVVFIISISFLSLLAIYLYSSKTWYGDEFLYPIIFILKEYWLLCFVLMILIGWLIITYIFINKPLHYLDEVLLVAQDLTTPNSTPIVLSDALSDIQNELNIVREQGLMSSLTAKEAEQRKNDLIVYLAHDLKTPLTSIIGYLTLLNDEPQISADLRAKYTGIAFDKALRLEDLINEFFDITRFNLTHLTLEKERINLTRMIEQISYEFNPLMDEKMLTWDLQLEPNVEIICDSDKLERVFDNLIRNAVNYSYSKSNVSIKMLTQQNYIFIEVKNRGKTISPQKLAHIFEQFFRLDSSRASKTGGAGLGLAIAKEIVELHDGVINVQSFDENIIFTVRLPR